MRALHRFVTFAAVLGLTLAGALAPAAAATPPDSPRTSLDLVSEQTAIAPGGAVWLGIRQRIAPGWHTYWINPGDSGEPLSMEWRLPEGFRAEPIVWPHPERIPVGPAMSHGYTDEAVLLVRVTVPADAREGTTVTLGGRASLLVCEKICIPEEHEIALTLPVRAGPALVRRSATDKPCLKLWPVICSAST